MVIWIPRSTCSSPHLRAVALQEFHLHVVERVEIREAVADRALQQRIALQQPLLPRDRQQRVDRGLPLRRMRLKIALRKSASVTSSA